MNKCYFIDSENVGNNWVSLLNTVTADDDILVFYTAKSPHMNYKNLILLRESPMSIHFIECCEGNNALDFQLSTELGFRIHEIEDNEFIIVSNDTGFDAIIKYWQARNKKVLRIKGSECSCLSEKDNPEEESVLSFLDSPVLFSEAVQIDSAVEAILQPVVDENAKELLYIIGKDHLSQLHEALQQLYGKKATAIYNAFKSTTAYSQFLAKHAKLNLADKQKEYCSIVFDIIAPDDSMPKDFPSFLVSSWRKKKNLNSLRALLQQKYKKELGDRYYSMFKMHIKIIDILK